MHFVDHEFIPWRHGKIVARPIELRIMNHAVSGLGVDLTGVRISPPKDRPIAAPDHEFVLVPDLGPRNFSRPVTVALVRERIGSGAPFVERARHIETIGKRSPNAKRRPTLEQNRAHAGSLRGREAS